MRIDLMGYDPDPSLTPEVEDFGGPFFATAD
jgi:hypothetical protein